MLAPLPIKSARTDNSVHSRSTTGTPTLAPDSQNSTEPHALSTINPSDDLLSGTTNVLLSIRLGNDYFQDDNTDQLWTWREWIYNMPPEAKAVKVEAIYESTSTLVLLSVPVTIWDALPDNPSYSFVGFVTSSNKVLELQTPGQLETISQKAEAIRTTDQTLSGQRSDDESKMRSQRSKRRIKHKGLALWDFHIYFD
jgi:hypothetical protein